MICVYVFFFFRQKTAYELRISDWSSDVCSSDLPGLAALGRRWIAPADGEAAGYDERRIALGVPEGAAELGVDKTSWLEANAVELNGVSFSKGCYVGQENTARMHHREKPRRRLLPGQIGGAPGGQGGVRAGERKSE